MHEGSPLKLIGQYFRSLPDGLRIGAELKELEPVEKEVLTKKVETLPKYGELLRKDWHSIYRQILSSPKGQKIVIRLLNHYQKHGIIELGPTPDHVELAEKIANDENFHDRLFLNINAYHPGFRVTPHGLYDAMHPSGIMAFHDEFRDAFFEAVREAIQPE